MFEPWIGRNYDATKLLLVGESAPSWSEGSEVKHPSERHPIELVEFVLAQFPANDFMALLSRSLASTETPRPEELDAAWAQAAFTVYIPGDVRAEPRKRPTPDAWQAAHQAFLNLLDRLTPRNVIVLGKDVWVQMPEASLSLTDDVQGYPLANGETVICWAVDPASAQFSWQNLAALIKFASQRSS